MCRTHIKIEMALVYKEQATLKFSGSRPRKFQDLGLVYTDHGVTS